MKQFIHAVLIVLLALGTAQAKTLMLEGKVASTIAMRQQIEFSVDRGTLDSFVFKFALPSEFNGRSVSQSIENLSLKFDPQPSGNTVEKDRFGNRFQKVSWNGTGRDIRVSIEYTAGVNSQLAAMESRAPFPVGRVSGPDAVFLKPTELVQSGDHEISSLARRLTAGARTEYEAVTAITNYVADTIKYTFNPPKYDALYTIETKSGNCQNFAHLCIALLRNVGIPARIVGGITLKDSWKVPIDGKNSIVQSMGQGGHAWMEIFFPDLGWLPYDPQQSRQFTSSRHIKQSHGLDSQDINDTWQGTPYLPRYSELIDGTIKNDDIKLKVKSSEKDPRPYILSNLMSGKPAGTPSDEPAEIPRTKPQVVEKPAIQPETKRPEPPKKPVKADTKPTQQAKVEPKPKPEAKPQPKPEPKQDAPAPKDADMGDSFLDEQLDAEIRISRPTGSSKPPKKPAKPSVIAKPSKPEAKPQKPEPKKPEPKVEIARVEPPRKERPEKPKTGESLAFGNMEFPNLVNSFSVSGNTATRILDKETSEYVTSQHIYAQAFSVKSPMQLDRVSLAMRKFGGDGAVYVDLVEDEDGKPNILKGTRSDLVQLDNISRKPGYYWVDFTFPEGTQNRLASGKYWIVLRASGEAIMNWFFIPGKPYGESDDTRSTAKGFQWEDILNYDFVFKVTGRSL